LPPPSAKASCASKKSRRSSPRRRWTPTPSCGRAPAAPKRNTPHTGRGVRDAAVPQQDPASTKRPEPHPTGTLEAEAASWEAKCARAKAVWAALGTEFNGHRPEAMAIEWDRDRVVVCIKALSLADWDFWLGVIRAPVDADTRETRYAQLAFGERDGVPVHLVAHVVPRLLGEACHAAGEPYFLWAASTIRHGRCSTATAHPALPRPLGPRRDPPSADARRRRALRAGESDPQRRTADPWPATHNALHSSGSHQRRRRRTNPTSHTRAHRAGPGVRRGRERASAPR